MFAFVVTMLQSYQICGRAPTAFPLSARPEPAARGPFSKKLRHASTAQRGVKKPFVHVFPRFAPRGVKVCCEKTPRRGLAATCSCHACPPLRPRCSFSVGFPLRKSEENRTSASRLCKNRHKNALSGSFFAPKRASGWKMQALLWPKHPIEFEFHPMDRRIHPMDWRGAPVGAP